MKKYVALLGLVLAVAGCKPAVFEGSLKVGEKGLSLSDKKAKAVYALDAGQLNARVEVKRARDGRNTANLVYTDGKSNREVRVYLGTSVGFDDSTLVVLPAATIGQTFNVEFWSSREVVSSDLVTDREPCGPGHGGGMHAGVGYWDRGYRDVTYRRSTTQYTLNVEAVSPQTAEALANFVGHRTGQEYTFVSSSLCRW